MNVAISNAETIACPSHGWEVVQDYVYTTMNALDAEYFALVDVGGAPEWLEVAGRSSHRSLKIAAEYVEPEGFDPNLASATTQQTAVAEALTETAQLWTDAVSNISTRGHGAVLNRQDTAHAIYDAYYQPYAMVSCGLDYIRGPHDDSAVAFPVPPGIQTNPIVNPADYNDSILGINAFVYPNITKDQLLSTPGPPEDVRLKWVELPQNPFNGSAIGAVILLPRPIANLTQEIILCDVGAGWGSSNINISSSDGGMTSTTSVIDPSAIVPVKLDDSHNTTLLEASLVSEAENLASDSVLSYSRPLFPEKLIIVTEAWATYLNPVIPSLNTTVIDALMSTSPDDRQLTTLEKVLAARWVLAGLLVNGLASIGATSRLQGDIKTIAGSDPIQLDGDYWFAGKGDMFIVDPKESKDWVKLRVDSTIEGYAYNIRGTSPKVAITFLLIYCVIALSHVLYAGISGKRVLHVSLLVYTYRPNRHLFHVLGLHRRSNGTSHEFHPYHSPKEHVRRYSGAEYLQDPCSCLGLSRRRSRGWRALGTCVRRRR